MRGVPSGSVASLYDRYVSEHTTAVAREDTTGRCRKDNTGTCLNHTRRTKGHTEDAAAGSRQARVATRTLVCTRGTPPATGVRAHIVYSLKRGPVQGARTDERVGRRNGRRAGDHRSVGARRDTRGCARGCVHA
eukprot:6214802-Pleurochrysis_carterae.AAC.1